MKTLPIAALLLACAPVTLVAEETLADLNTQRLALTKEIGQIREEHIKNTPELAALKAALDEQRKALWKKADESLKADPKTVELRTKLRAVNDAIKKAEGK